MATKKERELIARLVGQIGKATKLAADSYIAAHKRDTPRGAIYSGTTVEALGRVKSEIRLAQHYAHALSDLAEGRDPGESERGAMDAALGGLIDPR